VKDLQRGEIERISHPLQTVETAGPTIAKNPAFAGDPSDVCGRVMAESSGLDGWLVAVC